MSETKKERFRPYNNEEVPVSSTQQAYYESHIDALQSEHKLLLSAYDEIRAENEKLKQEGTIARSFKRKIELDELRGCLFHILGYLSAATFDKTPLERVEIKAHELNDLIYKIQKVTKDG